jgi:hypothetical protein
VRTGPWETSEDELLITKINELGRAWSSLARFFSGRSENDIKNRWYSHLKYQTVATDEKRLKLVTDPSESQYPDRKKRNRSQKCPKEAVMLLLEGSMQQRSVPESPPEVCKVTVESGCEISGRWFLGELVEDPFAFF